MKISKNSDVKASGEVMNVVNKILKGFDKFFERLADVDDGDEERIQHNLDTVGGENTYELEIADSDRTMRLLQITKGVGEDYRVFDFKLRYSDDEDDVVSKTGVKIKNDQYDDKMDDVIFALQNELTDNKVEGYESMKPIKSNSAIKLTLKKVTSSTDTSVELVNVASSYSVDETLDAINSLVSDDEFVAALPDNEASTYDLAVCDDGYEVDTCECCEANIGCAISNIIQTLLKLKSTSDFIGWNAVGPEADKLSSKCESLDWTIGYQIKDLAIMSARLTGYAPNPISLYQSIDGCWEERHFNKDEGFKVLIETITEVVNTMDLYWCNFSHEDQQTINSWISEWKRESDYLLARQFIEM